MIEYNKLSVDDIRSLIIKDSGGIITEDNVNTIKGKSKLVQLHQTLLKNIGISEDDYEFEEVENNQVLIDNVDTTTSVEEKSKEQTPEYTSEEWEEYVMSHFKEDELLDGYPLVNGLRRIVELLLGDIIYSGPTLVNALQETDGPGRATVSYEVHILWKKGLEFLGMDTELPIRKFGGVGGAWHGNTEGIFQAFPEAIAETRAEARALRKALRIKKAAAEELTTKNVDEIIAEWKDRLREEKSSELIQDVQKTIITKMCERLNINIFKFINSGSKTYDSIDDISRESAIKMIERLNQYQNDSLQIPENLKG